MGGFKELLGRDKCFRGKTFARVLKIGMKVERLLEKFLRAKPKSNSKTKRFVENILKKGKKIQG